MYRQAYPVTPPRREVLRVALVFHTSTEPEKEHIIRVANSVDASLQFVGLSSDNVSHSGVRNVSVFMQLVRSTEADLNLGTNPFGSYLHPHSPNLIGVLVTAQKFAQDEPTFGSIINHRPMGAALSLAGFKALKKADFNILLGNGVLRSVGKMLVTQVEGATGCPNGGCILEAADNFAQFVEKFGNTKRELCLECDRSAQHAITGLNYSGMA